jgi:hypothetical protein
VDAPPAPTVPPGALTVEETVFEAEAEPASVPAATPLAPETATARPAASGAVEDSSTPFSSSTLAELYFRQGLVGRAIDVYRQLLADEPGNERARARLAELASLPAAAEDRAARRRAIERTIAGLEAMLVAVRGR